MPTILVINWADIIGLVVFVFLVVIILIILAICKIQDWIKNR